MLFSSISFLYYFLPAVLLLYFLLPFKLKNYWLLLSSLFFYFWGEPGYSLLMFFMIAANYTFALFIGKFRGKPAGRILLAFSIVLCLISLGFFKYADFFTSAVNGITGLQIPLTRIPLPLGISFYTFQIMSYTIDVYRGGADALKNPFSFASYVTLFPQLVAGPIVRYKTVESALAARNHTLEDFAEGTGRFIIGLSKKVLIANQLGELRSAAAAPAESSVILAWLSVLAFALQVYFDFSGYSDMAIGMGRIFGFRFLENFDYPYMSKSVSEFWRRWHISLGTWFREYLYIPLGGSWTGRLKWLRNLFVVWFCTGLWHGASWNFVLWGLYFGVILGIEKLFLQKRIETWHKALRHIYTLLVVLFSFVIFHNDTLPESLSQFINMFGLSGIPAGGAETAYTLRSYAMTIILAVLGATPFPKKLGVTLREYSKAFTYIAEPVFYVCLLLLCTAYLVDSSFNPFLYFRF